MKKLFLSIFAVIMLFACEQENLPSQKETTSTEEEKFPVSFTLSMQTQPMTETEIIPMTKSSGDTCKTILRPKYKIIIVKQVGNQWILDTCIVKSLSLSGKVSYSDYAYTDNTRFDNMEIELRPGHYKISVFANCEGNMQWNEKLIPGTVIATDQDIQPDDALLVAYTYSIQKDFDFQDLGNIIMTREPFTGFAEFTLNKKGELQDNIEEHPEKTIHMKRRAGRLRYFLEQDDTKEYPFHNTAYVLNATVRTDSFKFCDGINILGGVYYDPDQPSTERGICLSTIGGSHLADNGKSYWLPTANATYYSPFILLDENVKAGLPCTFSNIRVSGQSGYPRYVLEENISIRYKVNAISGFILQNTGVYKEVTILDKKEEAFLLQRDTETDPCSLFHVYYESNLWYQNK